MNNISKYNDIDYIKNNFKDVDYIRFEYKNSVCQLSKNIPKSKHDKYQFYFECNTMYYELETMNFETIEEFFEQGTVEGELIKDIWSKVTITKTRGF